MSERIWNILVEGFVKIMLASIKVTIPLTVLGFSFAMIIAMFMAMVQYAKVPVLRQLSRLYIWVFRGTPLLVQLFLAYYGFPKIGIVLNSFVCAVIVFSLNEGAYCAETMRSALEAVPEGQMEAGYCVGDPAGASHSVSSPLQLSDRDAQGYVPCGGDHSRGHVHGGAENSRPHL